VVSRFKFAWVSVRNRTDHVQLTLDAGGFQIHVDAPSEKAGGYALGDDVTTRVDLKNARLIAEAAA
jgi:hypothetical protein